MFTVLPVAAAISAPLWKVPILSFSVLEIIMPEVSIMFTVLSGRKLDTISIISSAKVSSSIWTSDKNGISYSQMASLETGRNADLLRPVSRAVAEASCAEPHGEQCPHGLVHSLLVCLIEMDSSEDS